MARHTWLCACAGVAALALQADPANAQRRAVDCLAELGDVTVDGDLNVAGACTLNGTEVRGRVTLFSGGSLTARDAWIRGNLEGNRADFVDIDRSRIDGRVQLAGLVGDVSAIEQTEVTRNVELTGNRSRIEILNNDLGADLQVVLNTGGLLISGNAIDDDLRCTLNSPAPAGIANTVDGETQGQCENLAAPPAPPPAPEPSPPPPAPSPPPPAPAPTPEPAPPPASSPPPAESPPPTELAPDEGGAGAMGWLTALLLPLLARRRLARRSIRPR